MEAGEDMYSYVPTKIYGRSTVLNFKSTLKQATGAMEVKTEVLGLKGKIL